MKINFDCLQHKLLNDFLIYIKTITMFYFSRNVELFVRHFRNNVRSNCVPTHSWNSKRLWIVTVLQSSAVSHLPRPLAAVCMLQPHLHLITLPPTAVPAKVAASRGGGPLRTQSITLYRSWIWYSVFIFSIFGEYGIFSMFWNETFWQRPWHQVYIFFWQNLPLLGIVLVFYFHGWNWYRSLKMICKFVHMLRRDQTGENIIFCTLAHLDWLFLW